MGPEEAPVVTVNLRRADRPTMASDSGLLSARAKAQLNMFFVVMATLLLGNAIHVSVVTNEQQVTAFPVVAQAVLGLVFGGIGLWFRAAPKERDLSVAGTDEGDDEFDEELSPLDEEDLERLEDREAERSEE